MIPKGSDCGGFPNFFTVGPILTPKPTQWGSSVNF